MSQFQHFVLTRFNRGLYSKPKLDRQGKPIVADSWMKHRLDLFLRYCYPSLRHQSRQNFTWLVFWDAKTPEKFLRSIRALQTFRGFSPVFKGSFLQNVQERIRPDTRYVITTRIDNDDAFNTKAIETIQKQFNCQERLALNFPEGYCLHHSQLYLMRHHSNPFISLIERIQWVDGVPQIKTVMGEKHNEIARIAPIKQISSGRMWIQVVHGQNLLNRVKGKPALYPLEKIRNSFGI